VNPIRISGESGSLDLYVLNPAFDALDKQVTTFNNNEIDPDASILSLSQVSASAGFAVMMLPGNESTPRPEFFRDAQPWGIPLTLRWPGEFEDVLLLNYSGESVTYSAAGDRPHIAGEREARTGSGGLERLMGSASFEAETDAAIGLFRVAGSRITRYLLTNVSRFVVDGTPLVSILEGTANVSLSATSIHIDRDDIDFIFYAPGVEEVLCGRHSLAVIRDAGYIRRDWSRGGSGPPKSARHLQVRTYPNPFNVTTRVFVELGERTSVTVTVYDALGREVRRIWSDVLPRGGNVLEWDGKNNRGHRVTTGVYFVRAQIPGNAQTTKTVLIK
jgi:hypothetical protein